MPRKINALRLTSIFSVGISIFVMLVIVFECMLGRGTSPTVRDGFRLGSERIKIDIHGIFTSLPLVIFAYMYQVNVPAIYTELSNPNMSNIKTVLIIGTILAVIVYVFAGMFGYASFAGSES